MIDRIKQVMEYYKLTPASFSEQIGINRSNLTHLFTGRNQPSLELAKKILHCYPELRTEWLIMGVGEMWRSTEDKEFEMKVLNEKKLKNVASELNLFSISPNKQEVDTLQPTQNEFREEKVETVFEAEEKKSLPISKTNSEENPPPRSTSHNATLSKIIFFYSDSSFEVYHPALK